MYINHVKSIRNVEKYTNSLEEKSYNIGLKIDKNIQEKLNELGFPAIEDGYSMLPEKINGRFSKFNIHGSHKLRRDLPKEPHSYSIMTEITDWHGNRHHVMQTRTIQRIAREKIPAPEVELQIVSNDKKEHFVISSYSVEIGKTDNEKIKHILNLFLEIFRQVEFFELDMNSINKPTIERLNWEILPQGELPWEDKEKYIEKVAQNAKKSQKVFLDERLKTIESENPDLRAIGINGYKGYIVYGFSEKNLYIFESAFYGNATYIFKYEWKSISQLTKSEIINNNLVEKRLIHTSEWKEQLLSAIHNTK